jgi:hypothetical protein
MSGMNTCPETCPLKGNGCYAELGHSRIHWSRLTDGKVSTALEADQFIHAVASLPRNQFWRHNVAGDLPHKNGTIDDGFLTALTRANKGKMGFTYTHHALSVENLKSIEKANKNGFTVNVSANTVQAATLLKQTSKLPVVCILPIDAPNVQTVNDVKVVACPAEKSDKVTCSTCQLCQHANRDFVIGFRAHGVSKKKVDIIARG